MRRTWPGTLSVALLLTACGGGCPPERTAASSEPSTAGAEAAPASTGPESRSALPPEIRNLQEAPRRAAPPGTATVAILARGHEAFLARLEMEPGASVPEHQDPDEEYIFVLEGRGTMTIDGQTSEVGPGTAIFMPAGATVSFQNGQERMVAIQVFAGPGSADKYERWAPIEAGAAEPAAADEAAAEEAAADEGAR